MDKKIIFQKCSFNYIFFLLYFTAQIIFYFFYDKIISKTMDGVDEDEASYYKPVLQMIYIYVMTLSNFIAIIPFLIKTLYINKKKNDNNDNYNDYDQIIICLGKDKNKSLIYNNTNKAEYYKKVKMIIIYSFLIAFFEFFSECIIFIYFKICSSDASYYQYFLKGSVAFNVLLQFLLSYFLLNMHFYKLHYFSLILNFIIFIILFTLDLINIFDYEIFNGGLYLFDFANLVLVSFEYAFGKKLILYGFLSPYGLLIRKGIYQSGIVLIFSFIIIFIDKSIFIYIGEILKDIEYISFLIGLLISLFFSNLFVWFIIDRFSLCHLSLAFIFEEIGYFIIDLFFDKDINTESRSWIVIIRIILYLILFFGVMIHNEIIIINICGLGLFTKYFLDMKVKSEEIYSITDNPEVIKKYETEAELDIMDDDKNGKIN